MSYSDPLNSTKPCAKKQASTYEGTCLSRADAGRFQLEGSNIVELEFPPILLTANEVITGPRSLSRDSGVVFGSSGYRGS